MREIGRKLKVDAVLEGSFTRDGQRIRITARLNRTSDGCYLWSHSYEVDTTDLMGAQEEIANSIAAAIEQVGGHGSVAQVSASATKLAVRDQ